MALTATANKTVITDSVSALHEQPIPVHYELQSPKPALHREAKERKEGSDGGDREFTRQRAG